MDRVAFSESISNDPVTLVKDYFNELMAIYDLFGSYEGISVKGSMEIDKPISFWITFDSNTNAEDMKKIATGKELMIYGTLYKITGIVEGNAVMIQMT